MNKENTQQKRWILVIAVLIMLYFGFKDVNFAQIQQLSLADVMPILLLTALIILLKTSLLTALLVAGKKFWQKFMKRA